MIEIFYEYGSERDSGEAEMRGYRVDIYVKVNNLYYNIVAYNLIRLVQDFNIEIKENGIYVQEPNLILVENVTTNEIINVIKNLYEYDYFKFLKGVEEKDINQLGFYRRFEDDKTLTVKDLHKIY